MKHYLNPILAAIVSALVVSCYPYPEDPPPVRHKPNVTQQQQEAAEKAKADELKRKETAAKEAKKKADEAKKKEAGVKPDTDLPKPDGPSTPPPTAPKIKKDWPVAKKIPGRDDQVLSPYTNQPVTIRYPDNRIIPSGKIVGDPSFQGDPDKRFVVP